MGASVQSGSRSFDVAIAGAGPSGAAAALLFARKGFHVALLDQAHFPRDKACAEYLSPGVGDVIRRLGLEETLRAAHPLPVRGMEIVSPRGRILRVQYGFGPLAPTALTLSRRALDAALVEAAAASGVEVMEGFRVREPVFADGAVAGLSGVHENTRRIIRSRLTVAADGARSSLARFFGVARSPRWPVRLGLVAHCAGGADLRDGFGQMHVFPQGYCGVAPLPAESGSGGEGRLNVAMVVPGEAVRRSRVPATVFFDQWIAQRPRLRHLLAGCSRQDAVRGVGPIGARCRRASVPGGLVVGDAAGFFDPFTGEGIYRALRGAELAADVGERALHAGDVSARALSAYDRARRGAFRRKEAVTALVQLFVRYPSLLEYAVPRLQARHDALNTLGLVLGDLSDAASFLRPRMLWQVLRP